VLRSASRRRASRTPILRRRERCVVDLLVKDSVAQASRHARRQSLLACVLRRSVRQQDLALIEVRSRWRSCARPPPLT
jgi:hypothetical protein